MRYDCVPHIIQPLAVASSLHAHESLFLVFQACELDWERAISRTFLCLSHRRDFDCVTLMGPFVCVCLILRDILSCILHILIFWHGLHMHFCWMFLVGIEAYLEWFLFKCNSIYNTIITTIATCLHLVIYDENWNENTSHLDFRKNTSDLAQLVRTTSTMYTFMVLDLYYGFSVCKVFASIWVCVCRAVGPNRKFSLFKVCHKWNTSNYSNFWPLLAMCVKLARIFSPHSRCVPSYG